MVTRISKTASGIGFGGGKNKTHKCLDGKEKIKSSFKSSITSDSCIRFPTHS